MNRLRSIACGLALLASTLAHAQGSEVIAELRTHRFEDIEHQLQAVDAAFQAGQRVSEEDLLDAYKVFYMPQDVLSEDMAAWVHAMPRSSIARLASGTYRRKLGEMRRGQGFAQSVPENDQRYMLSQFELARSDLRAALRLNPRSYLAILNLMNIAMFTSDDALADEMLALGNAAYPRNLLIRARYEAHLAPRWGGSLAAMDAFIEAPSSASAPANVVQLLKAVRCNEQGFEEERGGRRDLAVATYRRCVELGRGADVRFLNGYLSNTMMHCRALGIGDDVATCR